VVPIFRPDRRSVLCAFGALAISPVAADASAAVTSVPIAEAEVIGEFHTPPRARHRTSVIMLNGSDGGVPSATHARDLARADFPTLALAYLRDATGMPAGVPATGPIPLEIVFRAIDWMKGRPEIAPERIVLMGVSRGAELALLVASIRCDVAGVVAFSPGSHVWGGVSSPRGYVFDTSMWSLDGHPLPYQVHVPKLGRPTREWFAAGEDVEAARIKVERIRGPLLLVSSTTDAIWPASNYADEIERRLREEGKRYSIRNLKFPDASHLLMGDGPAPTEVVLPGTNGYIMRFGGTAEGTLRARNASWAATKRFLRTVRPVV
jgi:dienelactone hydrolase